MTCPGCDANPGNIHVAGCDVERCAVCGGQRISCNCPNDETYAIEQNKYGGRLPWTGTWPGVAECIEFGWYAHWVDKDGKPTKHVPGTRDNRARCNANDEGARPDLNRLAVDARWNKELRKWEKIS